jgi:DNA-binding response OmpR family regulator
MVTILAIGQDPGLLSSRAAVLRKSKADVITADLVDAVAALKNQRFDLVVLCHTLSTEEMMDLGRAAHRLQNGVRVLQVVSDTEPYQQDYSVDADDVSPSNPARLVDKVIDMLHLAEIPLRSQQFSSVSQDNS